MARPAGARTRPPGRQLDLQTREIGRISGPDFRTIVLSLLAMFALKHACLSYQMERFCAPQTPSGECRV